MNISGGIIGMKKQNVLNLIKYVKDKVYEKFGIKIEEEIKIIGEE